MTPLLFDPDNPPDEPPPGVRQPLLWRLAIGLRRDHDLDRTPGGQPDRCRVCRAPWPCLVRRTAERALLVAFQDPPGSRRVRWFDPP
ncbi:MAG TPA: hypothetical protein VF755_06675 [Catenuloplanes sp.]|jgi:hypothetical protein